MCNLRSWHWVSDDGRYGMSMPATQIRSLLRLCADSNSVETGGILLGRYNRALTTAMIRLVVPPPNDSKRGPTSFERGVSGLPELLKDLWKRSKGYYVGEWHYHPHSSPMPSGQDLQQTRKIATDPAYCCFAPILLIVGGFRKSWTFSAQVVLAGAVIYLRRI